MSGAPQLRKYEYISVKEILIITWPSVRLHHRATDVKFHSLASVGACNLILHIHVLVNWQPRPQVLLAFQYGSGGKEDPGTQQTKTIADCCIPLRVHTCALIGSFPPKQRWLSFGASWRLRSAVFSVWDLEGGQNSGLIVWKTVTVPLEGKDLNIDIWNGNRQEYFNALRYFRCSCYLVCVLLNY